MSAVSSPVASPSSTPDLGNTGSGTGAATYYGAVALSIFILVALSLTSRILYTRKLRRQHAREVLELSRRGEEGGLPSYIQSSSEPHTLSYLTSPLSYLRRPTFATAASTHPPSSSLSPSSGDFIPPPSRTYHQGDTAAPPAYIPAPPKYETAQEDREPELGSTEQEVDASEAIGENPWTR